MHSHSVPFHVELQIHQTTSCVLFDFFPIPKTRETNTPRCNVFTTEQPTNISDQQSKNLYHVPSFFLFSAPCLRAVFLVLFTSDCSLAVRRGAMRCRCEIWSAQQHCSLASSRRDVYFPYSGTTPTSLVIHLQSMWRLSRIHISIWIRLFGNPNLLGFTFHR